MRLERMARAARRAKADVKVMLHGYDAARPSGNGPWLKAPMDRLATPASKHQPIIKRIVDSEPHPGAAVHPLSRGGR
jgi:hypothetical protein